jgi:hypothetical protein
MKKYFKELGEQYNYVWWWLLDQGILIATFLVNVFLFGMFAITMVILLIALKYFGKH